jgi:microcystin-dependent protein
MANKALIESITYMPSGVLLDFAGTTSPSGWAMCDGAAISRTTYPELFAAIGTAYGVGDGSTTFNLPDFRGRFARYNDNMGTGAASRDTGRVHGSDQTQTTAKNGLNASQSSHSHSFGFSTAVGGNSNAMWHNTGGAPAGGDGQTNGAVSGSTGSTAPSISLSGDAETRPINLSCNKIIKL